MRVVIALIAAAGLAGCATTTTPNMRPLTPAHIETMGSTPLSVAENNNGVEKSWFYTDTSASGAQYGLVGALVTSVMNAIINAGPARRAGKAADEMAELIPVDALNASLVQRLKTQISADPAGGGVTVSDVSMTQKLVKPDIQDDVVEVAARYTLSEDASVLRILTTVTYESKKTPYATPYTFKGSTPKLETKGPAYRNTFTYYSNPLPVPELTPELRERLIASIKASAADEKGAPPADGTTEFKSMTKELEAAADDKLTSDETAIFLTREWLKDDGARIREEIEGAHAFVTKYVPIDLNRTAVPSIDGADELLETAADQRTVRRVGKAVDAGSYVSSGGNLTDFSTYGNMVGIARVNIERGKTLREQGKREKTKSSRAQE